VTRSPAAPPRTLRVLALAPYPESAPSTRFRLDQFRAPLQGLGVAVTLHSFLSPAGYAAVRRGGWRAGPTLVRAAAELLGVLGGAGRYDVVWIQRGLALLLDRALLGRLVRSGVPLVYDFDDAVFLAQDGGRRWLEGVRDPRGTAQAFCRAAARIFAGNDYLADFATDAVGAGGRDRVQVVPSVVDTAQVVASHRGGAGPPTLGWVGSDSTIPYLESMADVLRSLASTTPHRLLVVAGRRRPRLPGVAVDYVPWTASGESALLGQVDVGLYPLDDTPWSRGKCGFKALQYLASGAPCVASPVGVLPDIVRHGETGLLAATPEEWVEACARLLADAELRRRMGERGRALVEERYSVAVQAPRVAAAFRAVVGA